MLNTSSTFSSDCSVILRNNYNSNLLLNLCNLSISCPISYLHGSVSLSFSSLLNLGEFWTLFNIINSIFCRSIFLIPVSHLTINPTTTSSTIILILIQPSTFPLQSQILRQEQFKFLSSWDDRKARPQKNPRLLGKGRGREVVPCSQDYLSSILLNRVDKTSITHPGDSWNCCQGLGNQSATGSRIISVNV